jgi:alkylation response protein AidB-like acyl-CoA dehydrogenase
VGAIETKLRVNRRLILGLAAEIDDSAAVDALDAHVVKSVVTNNAIEVIESALGLTGNHGLTRANPLQRHYRDALCGRVHTPQDDATRSMLGRVALA